MAKTQLPRAPGQASERLQQVCDRKRTYYSKQEAKIEGRKITSRSGNKMRPYQCKVCRYWHLTTMDLAEARRQIWLEEKGR